MAFSSEFNNHNIPVTDNWLNFIGHFNVIICPVKIQLWANPYRPFYPLSLCCSWFIFSIYIMKLFILSLFISTLFLSDRLPEQPRGDRLIDQMKIAVRPEENR